MFPLRAPRVMILAGPVTLQCQRGVTVTYGILTLRVGADSAQQTQAINITFIQRRPNVFDVV